MKRLIAAVVLALLPCGSATASTIPLMDLSPGLFTVSAGADPQMVHLSSDYALGGDLLSGWVVGGMASFDISGKKNQRESQTMGALRLTHSLFGTFPVTVGTTLSIGMNLVDPSIETPPDQQIYSSPYLFWFQPALNFSAPILGDLFSDNLWVRATFGPVIGRWTSGTYFSPFLSPNIEFAYRVHPSHEIVVGGGFWPWGLGWRGAF